MAEEICVKVYEYDELSPEAQETAREWWTGEGFDFWDEPSIEDAKVCGAQFGIEVDEIHYSGFWSQGDGACFEGFYSFKKGGVRAIKEHAPQDQELHRIAVRLSALQKRYFYGLTARVKHEGRYSHEHCTRIYVENTCNPNNEAPAEVEEEVSDLLKDFMRWIYRQLREEYEYQVSEEAVAETLMANQYEFFVDGKRAYIPPDYITKRECVNA